jgi:predicted metal-dependent hydrolase
MIQITFPGAPVVCVTLRRSAQARRYSLRVSRVKGSVTLTLPTRAPQEEAIAFARDKLDWIREHLGACMAPVLAVPGARILVEGTQRCVQLSQSSRTVELTPTELRVPVKAGNVGLHIEAFLKHRARDRLAAASDRYAAQLGCSYNTLSLRDTRSRWGSCSSQGRLMYSWRLVLAPPQVLDYVAAHEVAHLAEMNHSPRFWAHVATLCPDYARHRAWLRQEGETLHRYRFRVEEIAG